MIGPTDIGYSIFDIFSRYYYVLRDQILAFDGGYFFIFFSSFLLAISLSLVFILYHKMRQEALGKEFLKKTRIEDKPLYLRIRDYSDESFFYNKYLKKRKMLPKARENMYFAMPMLLEKDEARERIGFFISELDLDSPHEDQDFLVFGLKKLFSMIAYFGHSELELKQMLLDIGWDFHAVNSAFMEVNQEVLGIIEESFLIFPNENMFTVIKKLKAISAQGFTMRQVYEALLKIGYTEGQIKQIEKIIYLSQKASISNLRSQHMNILDYLRQNTSSYVPATLSPVAYIDNFLSL